MEKENLKLEAMEAIISELDEESLTKAVGGINPKLKKALVGAGLLVAATGAGYAGYKWYKDSKTCNSDNVTPKVMKPPVIGEDVTITGKPLSELLPDKPVHDNLEGCDTDAIVETIEKTPGGGTHVRFL